LTRLLAALETLRVPQILILVTQFVYRYLFVISEQAQHMRLAARSRGANFTARSRGLNAAARANAFQGAAGALSVLFVRSWERADGIYRAMLARGFTGRFAPAVRPHLHAADVGFLAAAVAACVTIRIAV
jgi:cobalt/nickel transport system permease protein